MDYEKKYKEALERARIWQEHLNESGDKDYAEELSYIFPKLKESEDEKIRKALIRFHKSTIKVDGIKGEDIIAWLEKQGEQKPTLPKWKYKNDNTPLLRDSLILNKYGCVAKSPSGAFVNDVWVIDYDELAKLPKEELEKQGEQETLCDKCRKEHPSHSCQDITELGRCSVEHGQKSDNSYCQENCKGFQETGKCFADGDCKAKREAESNDKNEPKFHEGDWVIDKQGIVHQIANVVENVTCHTYGYDIVGGGYFNDNTEGVRLWTIQDARDGDVLFHSDSASNGIFIFKEIIDKGFAKEVICHCDYDSEDHFRLGEHHTCCWTDAKILYPATKEQRDNLFAKMKEAGYTFDFEKKELKKVEQEQDSINPSEYINDIGGNGCYLKNTAQVSSWSKKDEKMFEYALNMIEWYSGKNEDKSRYVSDWLKSLKQRIGG